MKTLLRQDGTMVAVETASAIVDFDTILEATKVVYDDQFGEVPWDNCDGYNHEAESRCGYAHCDVEEMRGYCYWDGNREHVVITLPDDDDHGIFDWQRSMGATRQVAREAVAADRRHTLDQLVEWYSNGWQWYGVQCDFNLLGQNFGASVWGIDDDDYARNEVVAEVAGKVADQLEKADFTVTGCPDREPYPSREAKRARIRRNLNIQNWSE